MAATLPSAQQLARFTLAAQHPTIRQWADDEVRLRRLTTTHELDLRLATDSVLPSQRAEMMGVGQRGDAFLNRWRTVSDDLRATIAAGTLFDVLVDGGWAGYVGATSDGAADLGKVVLDPSMPTTAER